MDAKALAVLATAAAGGLVALLVGVEVVAGAAKDVGDARTLPWYYLAGGILGAAYVATVLVPVRTLGAGGVTAATIAGQLATSVVIDQFGLLGVARQPASALKLLDVAVLSAAAYLIGRQ